MSEWQPIETAPKDGTEVDLWISYEMTKTGYRIADCKFVDGRWRMLSRGSDPISHHEKPTHWMRQPEPPT